MPLAADKRHSFEDFLGICPPSRETRRRCRRAGNKADCNLYGEWSPLPEPSTILRTDALGVGNWRWPAGAQPIWPTSFIAAADPAADKAAADPAAATAEDASKDATTEVKDPPDAENEAKDSDKIMPDGVTQAEEEMKKKMPDSMANAGEEMKKNAPKMPDAMNDAGGEASKKLGDAGGEASKKLGETMLNAEDNVHIEAATKRLEKQILEEDHFEVSYKTAAILLGIAAISGGIGFAAAFFGRSEAAEPGPAEEEAEAEDVNPFLLPPVDPAEEEARRERIAELEAKRSNVSERRQELVVQQEELERELQPGLDEVDEEMRELDAQIAAATAEGAAATADAAAASGLQFAEDAPEEATEATEAELDAKVLGAMFEGDRLQRILHERVESVRERIPKLVHEELNTGIADLEATLDATFAGVGNMTGLPPLSIMLGGWTAPMQLGMLASSNKSRLFVSLALLSADVLAILTAGDTKCITWFVGYHGYFLRPWIKVDALMLLFSVVVRLMAQGAIDATLDDCDKFQNAPMDLPEEAALAFRMQLDRQLIVGSAAMVQLDKLASSRFMRVLDIMPVFEFVWQTLGISLTFDTPVRFCQAEVLMFWARFRGLVFLIGLLPAVFGVAVVVAQFAAKSQAARTKMLVASHEIDKVLFPQGPAVITLLVRAYLIRDEKDMQGMELQVLDLHKQLAHQEHDQLKHKLKKAEAAAAKQEGIYAAKEAESYEKSKEDEFMEHYQEVVFKVCDTLDVVADPAAVAREAAARLGAAQQHQATSSTEAAFSSAADSADSQMRTMMAGTSAARRTMAGFSEGLDIDFDGGSGSTAAGGLGLSVFGLPGAAEEEEGGGGGE